MSKTKKFLVPFEKDTGSLLHHAVESDHEWYRKSHLDHGEPLPNWVEKVEWRENIPFKRTILIDTSMRGRSAAYLVWKDTSNATFPMFLTDIVSLIREGRVEYGLATGWWNVAKRGQNYGIRFVSEKQPKTT